ncbi:hypothetical protein Tco_0668345 [Tanacetum coccineum]
MATNSINLWNNVIGALMNVPIFVGTFSVVMDFVVLEDMDAYRDKGMGDVIFGKPFLGEVAKEKDPGMVRLDPREEPYLSLPPTFKKEYGFLRYERMGDIIFGEPFLREVGIKARQFEGMITIYNGNDEVSDEDKNNGISHPYQKLKGFYKGVLNLGLDYIRDARTEEWLTRGHISVHEME